MASGYDGEGRMVATHGVNGGAVIGDGHEMVVTVNNGGKMADEQERDSKVVAVNKDGSRGCGRRRTALLR
ncbi:hypothetical protein NL676_016327 [Syzygium grande]|nr:hypothetical protein NL676_016327 [Syzygium grande]